MSRDVQRALLLSPEPEAQRYAPELVSAHLPTGMVLRASQASSFEQACAAAREGIRSGVRLLIAAGSEALFRAVAACALGERQVRVAFLPSAPSGLLARWLGTSSTLHALSRLASDHVRAADAARVNGRPMMVRARLGHPLPAVNIPEDPCAELLLDGLRLDARLAGITVGLAEPDAGGRGLAVTLHRARVDPRLHTRSLAAYEPTLCARHPDGSATWQLRVRRFTARLTRPLGLSIDGGPPAPGFACMREPTSVLYAEHLPGSLALVG